jgi:hypothetical protein
MKITVIVERIDNEIAILDAQDFGCFSFPILLLPSSIHEGSALQISIVEDPELEAQRKAKIKALQDKLSGNA